MGVNCAIRFDANKLNDGVESDAKLPRFVSCEVIPANRPAEENVSTNLFAVVFIPRRKPTERRNKYPFDAEECFSQKLPAEGELIFTFAITASNTGTKLLVPLSTPKNR